MFENSNKEMVTEIAAQTMRVHKLRNVMACIAIALTTILIMIICGTGVSIVRANMKNVDMNPGPGTHGSAIRGDMEVFERILGQPEVEWADIVRPGMMGTPRNKEFMGNNVQLLGVSDGYYGHHYVDLICGEYPKNANEVLMSDTLAEKCGIRQTPGQTMVLNLMVIEEEEQTERPVEVMISGFYDNPLRAIENYEELYTTADFQDLYNPELNDRTSKIFTKIEGLTARSDNEAVEQKLEALNKAVEGEGAAYIYRTDISVAVMGAAALLLLIIACGYFLIYNIFYISVVNDIRFMGTMKTIGMTGKQIRQMLWYQVRRIGAVGILIGLGAGILMSMAAVRMIQEMDFNLARYMETGTPMLFGGILAVVFAVFTVWVSSRKAFSLAAKISPVEAARFRAGGKKKRVMAVVSFALSGVLFCSLFAAMMGYDPEWMVNRMNEADFRLGQYHAGSYMEEPYQVMEKSFCEKVSGLPFVEESYIYYRARNPQLPAAEENEVIYSEASESYGEIRYEGQLQEILEQEEEYYGGVSFEENFVTEEGNYTAGILGMPVDALAMEGKYLDILSGELDDEKFASGDYLIYQPYDPHVIDRGAYSGLQAGETLTLSFYSYERHDYVTKDLKVMAVVTSKEDIYAGEIGVSNQFILPDTVFREIYGEGMDNMISAVLLNTSGSNLKGQQEALEQAVQEGFNSQVQLTSKYSERMRQLAEKKQKAALGIFVGLVFGFIGIANIMNTLVTGVLARKMEYAALQSIGMTKRQMAEDIFKDGMKMIGVSLVILTPVGAAVAASVSRYPVSTGFVPGWYAVSVALVLAAGILIVSTAAVVLTKMLNQKAVVERLREAD